MAAGYTPDFDIKLNGSSIKSSVNDHLEELTVTDEAGLESDSCTITLDNRNLAIAPPRTGALLQVWLGYRETGLDLMGLFTVADVTAGFSPQKLVIQGHAAEMKDSFKEPKTRPFEEKTIGDIISQIAGEHGLSASVGQDLAGRKIPYVGQTEESDLHLLQRLARHHGATFKPANGHLMFVKKGAGKSVTGRSLGTYAITPPLVISGSINAKGRPEHKEAKAHWHDRGKAQRRTETGPGGKQGPAFLTRHSMPSEAEARWWAQARATELQRQEKTLTAELIGDTAIAAEMTVTTQGLSGLDDTFSLTSVNHQFTGSGFTTSIDGELQT